MKIRVFYFCIAVLLLASCGASDNEVTQDIASDQAVMNETPVRSKEGRGAERREEAVSQPPEAPSAVTRKLIKNGFLTFETGDLAKTKQKLTQSILSQQGYISAEQQYRSPDRISQVLTVRVPSANFDKLITAISEEAERFDEKNINVQDVTEEYIDIEARLNTKKELEKRYLDLLKRANSVKDLVEIERELANVRAEIESMEGRLKYLDKEVDYSTLTLTFYEQVHGDTALTRDFTNGLRNGWKNLVLFFIALINIWPFLILLAALVFVLIRFRRKKRKGTTK